MKFPDDAPLPQVPPQGGPTGRIRAVSIWPPLMEHFFETSGWRATYIGLGIFSLLAAIPLAWLLRRRPPAYQLRESAGAVSARTTPSPQRLGLSGGTLQTLLCVAGVACCVAMSMPQVHIVAYCGDLGYAAARGAEMMSLMLGFGIVSRLASGWLSDRIGGIRTLLVNSVMQCTALVLFLPSDQMSALYAASALFGLFQGGLIPSYALIIREYFPAREAGARTGTVLMATLFGMALGGWMAGAIFDLTGSYLASFVNAIGWNLLNLAISLFLLHRSRGGPRVLSPAI